jgi:hypothetical protein
LNPSHPVKILIASFNRDETSEQASGAFTVLHHADEFHKASSFREQLFATVGYIRTDALTVPFSDILSAHFSDQTQPCDCGIVEGMKAYTSRIRPATDIAKHSKQAIKIVISVQTALCLRGDWLTLFARASFSHFTDGCWGAGCSEAP